MSRTQIHILVAAAWIMSLSYATFATATMVENVVTATCGVLK